MCDLTRRHFIQGLLASGVGLAVGTHAATNWIGRETVAVLPAPHMTGVQEDALANFRLITDAAQRSEVALRLAPVLAPTMPDAAVELLREGIAGPELPEVSRSNAVHLILTDLRTADLATPLALFDEFHGLLMADGEALRTRAAILARAIQDGRASLADVRRSEPRGVVGLVLAHVFRGRDLLERPQTEEVIGAIQEHPDWLQRADAYAAALKTVPQPYKGAIGGLLCREWASGVEHHSISEWLAGKFCTEEALRSVPPEVIVNLLALCPRLDGHIEFLMSVWARKAEMLLKCPGCPSLVNKVRGWISEETDLERRKVMDVHLAHFQAQTDPEGALESACRAYRSMPSESADSGFPTMWTEDAFESLCLLHKVVGASRVDRGCLEAIGGIECPEAPTWATFMLARHANAALIVSRVDACWLLERACGKAADMVDESQRDLALVPVAAVREHRDLGLGVPRTADLIARMAGRPGGLVDLDIALEDVRCESLDLAVAVYPQLREELQRDTWFDCLRGRHGTIRKEVLSLPVREGLIASAQSRPRGYHRARSLALVLDSIRPPW